MEFNVSSLTVRKNKALLFLQILTIELILFPTTVYSQISEQIFILHSYSQEYPWTRDQHSGFTSNYYSGTQQQAIISTEYLDTKRKPYSKKYAEFFASYLQQKYANYEPGVIYVTDDNALNFAVDYLRKIFPKVSIFFSGVNDYTKLDELDPTVFTGVFEKKEIAPNIKLLQLIDPEIDEILVVGDGSNTYNAIKHEINLQLQNQSGIKAQYISTNKIEELTDALEKSKQKYLFLTTIGSIVGNKGVRFSLEKVIELISKSGDFVIISMEDAYQFRGVLGGYVTSGTQQGSVAANLALKYHNGEKLTQLPPVTSSPNVYMFDYSEMIQNQLSLPAAILEKSIILNQPVSFYDKNRSPILVLIIILTVLLFVSMATFLSILARKNKYIQSNSKKIHHQAEEIEETSKALTNAQNIANLGSWEWKINSDDCHWSDEMFRIMGEQPQVYDGSYRQLLSYVHPDDRVRLEEMFDEAFRNCQPYDLEHRLVQSDGTVKHVRQTGNVYCDKKNNTSKVVGVLLDISNMKNYELLELDRRERIERYQDALLEWSQLSYNTIDQAFQKATEISAHTLGVSRVSIWLYNSDRTAIVCHDLYKLNENHENMQNLDKEDFPNYFRAIDPGKILEITDARNDTRSKEFTEAYLIPNDIYSMLDVPIMYQGEIAGVVCHEHTSDKRQWELHEIEFASAISNTVALSLEIEKRKKIENKLEHQAFHDVLTKLPNRSLFMDRLEQAIRHAHRIKSFIAVLFLDLDKFKEINDSLGHAVGDQVLITIAKKIRNCLREEDTISRLGGDEYCLILESFKKRDYINDIATKLLNELQKPMLIDGNELYVTSSIGISIYPDDGETSDTLLRNADAAMYKSKEDGNSFQFYTEDMTERAFERVRMESNLRHAIEREEFIVYYQPQYDTSCDNLIGLEALIRWRHPDMGLVSPAKFISLAEETGFIVELDRWVFTTALEQLSAWHKQGLKTGRLAFNLAMKQLRQEDLFDFIIETLEKTQCQPEWIAFEVTESQIMDRPEHAIRVLQDISNLGIEIAVDDFGTGYSSLAYLKRLPVDKLKIDQTFVRDVPSDEEDVAIVCAIIALGKSLKLSIIAEGVENIDQKNFLLDQGCHLIQGYLFGRPMPAKDIEQHLLERKK